MAQLTAAFFQKILAIEGGYQDLPDDTGNYSCGVLAGTKYGVSAVALSDWWGRCVTADDVKNLTPNDAFNFYSWYFDRYNLYQIENQQFAELLMNNTMGSPAGAARVEQQTLLQLGYNVSVDGQRGPQTIAALNDAWRKSPDQIYNAIRENWITYLKGLNKPQFLPGWLARMERYFPPIGVAVSGGLNLFVFALVIIAGYKLFRK